jgi:hypothetical protein
VRRKKARETSRAVSGACFRRNNYQKTRPLETQRLDASPRPWQPLSVPTAVSSTVLNLGSGKKPRPGAVNVDVTERTRPDLVHDLNVTPWPLPKSHFTEVHIYDVVEHLKDVSLTMEEIHRVCAPGARVFITVPHFSSANSFTDPTHRHFFGARSMLYFTEEHELGYYSSARFLQRQAKIVFTQSWSNKVVRRLANRFVVPYEERWAWLFPAWFLYFELEVVKPFPA